MNTTMKTAFDKAREIANGDCLAGPYDAMQWVIQQAVDSLKGDGKPVTRAGVLRVIDYLETAMTEPISHAETEFPKLAKALMTYKPHSRIMPRCEAVKLWKELKALGYERECEDVDLVKLEGMVEHCFTFHSMGSRTRVGWGCFDYADHGGDDDFDPKKEGVDTCEDIDQAVEEAIGNFNHYNSENDGLVDSLLALDMSSHTKREPIVNGRYVTKGEVQP